PAMFFFQAEDGIRAFHVTGVQTCALPIYGKARFNVAEYRPPVDDVDETFSLFLTTGRVVSQFLSGTQTRRIGPLVKQYPEPRIRSEARRVGKGWRAGGGAGR